MAYSPLQNYADKAFQQFAEKIQVFLPTATTKNAAYDKYRDVGYQHGMQNYLTVKAILRDVKPETLVFKQLGLINTGCKYLTIHDKDVSLIKLSQKLMIKDVEYYVYSDAVGNKMQMTQADFGYSIILVFRKN